MPSTVRAVPSAVRDNRLSAVDSAVVLWDMPDDQFLGRSSPAPSSRGSSTIVPITRPTRMPWREARLVFAFWGGFAFLNVANRVVAFGRTALAARDIAATAFVSVTEAVLWAGATLLVFSQAEQAITARRGAATMVWRFTATGLPISVALGALGALLRVWFSLAPPSLMQEPMRVKVGIGIAISFVTYGAVVAAAMARAYSRRYEARDAHAARLEAQLASAQLDALRQQLDPHFLFNTLNLIASLADTDARAVRRMIARLSELLRFTLDGGHAPEHPLKQELAILERYLDIVRMRFGARLDVSIQVDDRLLDAMVPSLILQPLLENAIRHGVEKIRGVGRVAVEAHAEGDTLVLRILDNGPGTEPGAASSTGGVGVRNTVARLRQLYDDAAQFTLVPADHGGTVAQVCLPLRTPAVLHAQAVSKEARRVGS